MTLPPEHRQPVSAARLGIRPPTGQQWPLNRDSLDTYYVNTIYPTIQGEGGLAGTPMTLVRLQGCPVGCVFCDTAETWPEALPESGRLWAVDDIVSSVVVNGLDWVLVTGGEPTWHDLMALTRALSDRGRYSALETAGVFPITGLWDYITLSPKPQGRLPLRPEALHLAHEIKWLVGKPQDIVDFKVFLRLYAYKISTKARLSLQPISQSRRATELCLQALMVNPTWRLSLQMHKYVGIA